MRFLHSLFLVLVLAICYLVFFRSQGAAEASRRNDGKAQADAALTSDTHFPATQARTQYKADMDRAHAVANQMKASHQEADSF